MYTIMAPDRIRGLPNPPTVFLADSIDMGAARNWQIEFEKRLAPFPGTIYNPRRDDWDSSWQQTDSNEQFRSQVEWELQFINHAQHVFMFISSESKAPITLLEFGLIAGSNPEKLHICVEQGFWRRGNIEVVCRLKGIPLYDNLDKAIDTFMIKLAANV